MSDKMFRQNEVLIGLRARSTLGIEAIYDVVTRQKRDPAAYVRTYNSLRGDLTVSEAAKLAGVSQPAMSEMLASWEAQGVVYNVGDRGKPEYHRLLKLPEKRPD